MSDPADPSAEAFASPAEVAVAESDLQSTEAAAEPAVVRVGFPLLTRISGMMFGQYLALGLWSATVATYIKANTAPEGMAIFGSSFAGVASMSGALGALVAPMLFGSIADGMFSTQRLLSVLNALCAVSLVMIALAESQLVFFVGITLYFQFAVPTLTLTNSLALRHCDSDPRAFPICRSIGTSGWIVAMVIIGSIAPLFFGGKSIDATSIPMWLGFVVHVGMTIYCLTLPHTPPVTSMVNWRRIAADWTNLLRREPRLARFLAVAIFATLSPQFFNVYLNPFLNDAELAQAASWMAWGQVTEVVVILTLPAALQLLGPKRTFFIGLLAWAVRYVALMWGGAEGWPFALTMISILVHGVSYAFVYMTGYLYVNRVAPKEYGAVAQGMFAMATSGVGHLVGSLIAGWAQSRWITPPGVEPTNDWYHFWMLAALLSAFSAVVFLVTMGLRREVE